MNKLYSFQQYVSVRFREAIFDTVSRYFIAKYKESNSQEAVELCGYKIIEIIIYDVPRSELQLVFDLSIQADLNVYRSDLYCVSIDQQSRRLFLRCTGDLRKSLNDFSIMTVYSRRPKRLSNCLLSDALMPVINEATLDQEARRILDAFCPEALSGNATMIGKKLAQKLKLKIIIRTLRKSPNALGKVFISPGSIESSTADSKMPAEQRHYSRNVILNSATPQPYSLKETWNYAIVHECVHWILHRKAFEFMRLQEQNLDCLICEMDNVISEKPIFRLMEWQADMIALAILLPVDRLLQKYREFTETVQAESDADDPLMTAEEILSRLSKVFHAPLPFIQKRLTQCGIRNTCGVAISIDGVFVKPHMWEHGALQANQTFCLTVSEAAKQSLQNDSIRNGHYLYVDSHFVLNHPKYVALGDDNNLVLTPYALHHMEECCLIFSIKSATPRYRSLLRTYKRDPEKYMEVVLEPSFKNGVTNDARQKEIWKKIMKEEQELYAGLCNDYCKCLQSMREKRGLTFRKLEEYTKLGDKNLRDLFAGNSKGSIEALVLICLALHLPPIVSRRIIELSPHSLVLTDHKHYWYNFVLTHLYGHPIIKVKQFLTERGAAITTRRETTDLSKSKNQVNSGMLS